MTLFCAKESALHVQRIPTGPLEDTIPDAIVMPADFDRTRIPDSRTRQLHDKVDNSF